jgi:glucosyl-3-phosphoglycerate synthase
MTDVQRWYARNSFHHADHPAASLAALRERTISVCLPARDEATTIGPILERLLPLLAQGAIDQLVVVDDSGDGTAEIARRLGAEVHDQSALLPEQGPVAGKGDAMWRALSVLTGDVVVYLDADSEDLGEHYACGLAGPIACGEDIRFTKGFYRRPFRLGGVAMPDGGGRVTELAARPLLNRFFPELAGFVQPLAGEIAARRDLLESLPFATGYGVDIGLLIDAWRAVGLDALGQVDLDTRQNRHQSLEALGPMAYAVLEAVAERLQRDGRLEPGAAPPFLRAGAEGVEPAGPAPGADERPPMAWVRSGLH